MRENTQREKSSYCLNLFLKSKPQSMCVVHTVYTKNTGNEKS